MKLATAEQMREIDRRTVDEFKLPSLLLMENAGRAVAERAAALRQSGSHIALFCGGGNNGGDGLAAARHLCNRGIPVKVVLAADPQASRGDPLINLQALQALGVTPLPAGEAAGALDGAAAAVDALLGTGFRGEPRAEVAALLGALSEFRGPILGVDLPSGLDSETGQPCDLTPRCSETVTLGLPKPGLALYPGREYAGAITVAGISLPRPLLDLREPALEWLAAPAAALLWPLRAAASHKGDSGRLTVLAGSPGLTGAAILTCRAALRAGAGLVKLAIPRSLNSVVEGALTEAMTLPLPETGGGFHSPESLARLQEELEGGGALVVGPGLGRNQTTRGLLIQLFQGLTAPTIIDADGLNLMAPARKGVFPPGSIITPHPGEMARLLGTQTGEVQSNRLETARKMAREWNVVVVLKGAGTAIAAPDGRAAVNSSGSSALATGGTGDVLAGVMGACLARGLDPYDAARAAVWLHGAAGEAAGEAYPGGGAVAGDVVEALPEALKRLHRGNFPLPYRTME